MSPLTTVDHLPFCAQDELNAPLVTTLLSEVTLDSTSEAADIVESICSVYERLASLRELKPSAEVNSLFGQLVATCIQQHPTGLASQIFANKRIRLITPWLRQLCSKGEGELERFWARKILNDCQLPNRAIVGEDRG